MFHTVLQAADDLVVRVVCFHVIFLFFHLSAGQNEIVDACLHDAFQHIEHEAGHGVDVGPVAVKQAPPRLVQGGKFAVVLGKQHVVEQNDVDVGRPVVEPTVAHGQAQGYAAGQNFRLGKAARFHAHLTVAFRHPQRFQQAFPIFRRTVRHIQPMFGPLGIVARVNVGGVECMEHVLLRNKLRFAACQTKSGDVHDGGSGNGIRIEIIGTNGGLSKSRSKNIRGKHASFPLPESGRTRTPIL